MTCVRTIYLKSPATCLDTACDERFLFVGTLDGQIVSFRGTSTRGRPQRIHEFDTHLHEPILAMRCHGSRVVAICNRQVFILHQVLMGPVHPPTNSQAMNWEDTLWNVRNARLRHHRRHTINLPDIVHPRFRHGVAIDMDRLVCPVSLAATLYCYDFGGMSVPEFGLHTVTMQLPEPRLRRRVGAIETTATTITTTTTTTTMTTTTCAGLTQVCAGRFKVKIQILML
ncbi:MAG: hypothetical protein GY703_08785 [Gammaproteobacteria bacterium]|nr:hypothetical protein [Gammaproteobacteria bacterium]